MDTKNWTPGSSPSPHNKWWHKITIKHIVAAIVVSGFLGIVGAVLSFFVMSSRLPQLVTVEDYKPLVVSELYSRDGKKVGEFYREKRIVVPYSKIPKLLVQAFISAEDSRFFEHGGINFLAIGRAMFANLRAGHMAQGGSTITQQVAKSLMLTPEKKLSRKIKEAILAYRMEKNLKKEDILYLYLNQIYLGHGAYGVEAAAQNYFRKSAEQLTLAECAILAGLPQAPGKYSPVLSPLKAKERQLYVINRMKEEGYITADQAKAAANELVKVYFREEFEDIAPYYKETIRQFLTALLGEEKVLDEGIRITSGMDYKKQLAAQDAVEKNLRDLDKRQGFRPIKRNLATAEDIAAFLVKEREDLYQKSLPYRVIYPDGKEPPRPPLDLSKKQNNRPTYISIDQVIEGVVTKIDSKWGLVTVRYAENQGLIDIDDMTWARKPDVTKHFSEDTIKDPAQALKVGDVIEIRLKADRFTSKRIDKLLKAQTPKGKKLVRPPELPVFEEYALLSLEQEPIVEGALLSYDLDTGDVLSMVGGIDFEKSKYNRALQASRQTGSTFKGVIYASALDKGMTAATTIVDAPVVYEEGEGQESKKWKPGNFEGKFSGDVLFRNAIIKSLNIPTVKILEKVGTEWVARYARRLGIFSPLNMDGTMALGSSSITLFEMTKAFATYPRGGKRFHPILIRKVTDSQGKTLIENVLLEERFRKELNQLDLEFHPELADQIRKRKGLVRIDEDEEAAAAIAATPSPTIAAPVATAPLTMASAQPSASPVYSNIPAFNFQDPEQLISPQTAYLITHLLKGVVNEGTGWRAKALGRPAAGKTGTTNGYFDAWFLGYTPHVVTGTWVGFDDERPIGRFETGNASALPIWVDYMMVAVEDTPASDFAVPPGIVFVNIDSETGKLASARSKKAVREAFREGSEPSEATEEKEKSEEKDFLKEDLSD